MTTLAQFVSAMRWHADAAALLLAQGLADAALYEAGYAVEIGLKVLLVCEGQRHGATVANPWTGRPLACSADLRQSVDVELLRCLVVQFDGSAAKLGGKVPKPDLHKLTTLGFALRAAVTARARSMRPEQTRKFLQLTGIIVNDVGALWKPLLRYDGLAGSTTALADANRVVEHARWLVAELPLLLGNP